MTDRTAEALRADYLGRLDSAMRGLPHGVASDIRDGVAEELLGLDADGTALRIAQLGDPATIAREAQDEVPAGVAVVAAPAATAPSPPRPSAVATRGFAIAAALALGFGGFVVPVLGWVVGAVLVVLSPLWRAGEKAVAIIVPFACASASLVLVQVIGFSAFAAGGSATGSGVGPGEAAGNPLIPAWYDVLWTGGIVLGFVLVPASGLWLLWRLRGRGAR